MVFVNLLASIVLTGISELFEVDICHESNAIEINFFDDNSP